MKTGKHLLVLDSVRGLAATYVIFNHLLGTSCIISGKDISFLFRFGQEAVILFFLLSGFVIQYSYNRTKDKSFKTFFFKRLIRIYIPLFIVYATNYLLLYIQHTHINLTWQLFFGNLFMLQDLPYPTRINVICTPIFNNIPLWSLSYEWWFYMLYLPMLQVSKKNSSNWVYILCIASTVTYILYPFFVNRLLMYLMIWWIGVDLAKLYNANQLSISSLKIQFSALIICAVLLSINFIIWGHGWNSLRWGGIGFTPFLELRNFTFAIIILLFALWWRSKNWIGFTKTIGIFLPLAPISFCLYISHWFLIIEAHYLDNIVANLYIRYTLYFVVCLAFSYLVEKVLYVYINNKTHFIFRLKAVDRSFIQEGQHQVRTHDVQ